MQRLQVRVPDAHFYEVLKRAKSRGIDVPDMWRLIIERGLYAEELENNSDDVLEKIGIETLCIMRRFVGENHEELLVKAKDDAKKIISSLKSEDK